MIECHILTKSKFFGQCLKLSVTSVLHRLDILTLTEMLCCFERKRLFKILAALQNHMINKKHRLSLDELTLTIEYITLLITDLILIM